MTTPCTCRIIPGAATAQQMALAGIASERLLLGVTDAISFCPLHAAAPELLLALKQLCYAINAVRKDLGTKYPALAEAWGRGYLAIAAAEGSAR